MSSRTRCPPECSTLPRDGNEKQFLTTEVLSVEYYNRTRAIFTEANEEKYQSRIKRSYERHSVYYLRLHYAPCNPLSNGVDNNHINRWTSLWQDTRHRNAYRAHFSHVILSAQIFDVCAMYNYYSLVSLIM